MKISITLNRLLKLYNNIQNKHQQIYFNDESLLLDIPNDVND